MPRKTPAGAGTTAPEGARAERPAEDPRGCGDDPRSGWADGVGDGRPPRVRGRRRETRREPTAARKTPAGAGTTFDRPELDRRYREDPRGCGDDWCKPGCGSAGRGRPPRVRGRHDLDGQRARPERKTPAGAGTTDGLSRQFGSFGEDPRGCGDDRTDASLTELPLGRPPRVRGRPLWWRPATPTSRKTPAGAGTTTCRWPATPPPWEDPRGCGDDAFNNLLDAAEDGRPPRVRGRPPRSGTPPGERRKTPAGAGTTLISSSPSGSRLEDPRGCGDDPERNREPQRASGRPPRVRGRRLDGPDRREPARKTPAGAGTTPPPGPPTRATAEDPRGCGDDPAMAFLFAVRNGRPPRVRGRPERVSAGLQRRRKTPAGAGTTPGGCAGRGCAGEDPRGCGDDW